MKLANYVQDGQTHAGLISGSKLFPVKNQSGSVFGSVDEILASSSLDWVRKNEDQILRDGGIALDSVKLKSPVLKPEKIYCAAVNYMAHSKEQNTSPPTEPYFFTKFRNALIGPEDDILLPKISKQVDWEAELAVIIGKKGKDIPKEKAMEYVAGYTVANDISFRDLQKPGKSSYLGQNWVKGKGLDTAFPLGPLMVTTDEMKDPYSSELSLTVNGVTRQKSGINDMVFKIDSLIEFLSTDITLVPGDVVSTGTPEGVAAFTGLPFLKDGDVVEASVRGIGTLRNRVRAQ